VLVISASLAQMRIDRLAQGGEIRAPSATISTTPPGISRASAAPFIAQSLQQASTWATARRVLL
jgi:hypothetical protein